MADGLRRGSRWWWAAAVAWMVLLFGLSSRADLPGPTGLPEWLPLDKLAHLMLFAVLGALLRLAGLRLPLAVAGAAVYGLTDEIHQMFVPGRESDVVDWLADVSGAALGAWSVRFPARSSRRSRESVE